MALTVAERQARSRAKRDAKIARYETALRLVAGAGEPALSDIAARALGDGM